MTRRLAALCGALKIALYAAGEGTVVFRDFRYLGL